MSEDLPKLLVLYPSLPYPPASGGDIRAYHLLRRLARHFEVRLVAGWYGDTERLIAETGIVAVHVPWQISYAHESRAWKIRKRIGFWRGSPHQISLDVNPAIERVLRYVLSQTRVDAVLIDHLWMMPYARFVRPRPVLYSATDVETTKYARWYRNESISTTRRLLYWLQAKVIRRAEARLGRDAEVVFATSETDRDVLQRMNRTGRFVVAANGVDLDYFRPRSRKTFEGRPAILFVGSLHYKPNAQAATFLAEQVFPRIRRQMPDAICHLVGNRYDKECEGLHKPVDGVLMHGLVPDIRPYIEQAQIFVAPLFIGSGTRIKIIEAMATGTPVVATSIGAEGINFTNGENIVIADSAESLAAEIVSLLRDRDRCARLGAAGRTLVEREYTWDASAEVIRGEIERILAARPASEPGTTLRPKSLPQQRSLT